MKVSELIRLAADKYLWDGKGKVADNSTFFSCSAVELAFFDNGGREKLKGLLDEATDFLESLGVNPWNGTQFFEFKSRVKRQGARFLWLHFAALVAEDEENEIFRLPDGKFTKNERKFKKEWEKLRKKVKEFSQASEVTHKHNLMDGFEIKIQEEKCHMPLSLALSIADYVEYLKYHET